MGVQEWQYFQHLGIPNVPDVSNAPNGPKVPIVPNVPEVPHLPDISNVPNSPSWLDIVDKLLRKQSRGEGGKVIAGYWVKWQGHSARDATWEPAANLPQHMVAKYESKRGRYYK